jgi:SAM-dependent methyltransferase
MTLVDRIHESAVHPRRVQVLSERLAQLIPRQAHVLDVGCGDGLLDHLIAQRRADVCMQGIDVLVRTKTHIPVRPFDGSTIPYADASLDVVMLVDVLHHTEDPMVLLREAVRTARKAIVIKDHTRDGLLAEPTLRFMDWVGNARHGVNLPYNYWSRRKWVEAYQRLGLEVGVWLTDLRLYPWPASLVFDRSLHFIARLDVSEQARASL